MRKAIRVLAAILVGGCVNIEIAGTPVGPPAKIEAIQGNGQTVNVGVLLYPLVVKISDASGQPVRNAPVRWTVGRYNLPDESITTLTDAAGTSLITPVASLTAGQYGAAVARTDGVIEYVVFQVRTVPDYAAKGTISPSPVVLKPGQTQLISAQFADKYGNAFQPGAEWATTDSSVVTIDGVGRAKGLRLGSAFIVARRDTARTFAPVTVANP